MALSRHSSPPPLPLGARVRAPQSVFPRAPLAVLSLIAPLWRPPICRPRSLLALVPPPITAYLPPRIPLPPISSLVSISCIAFLPARCPRLRACFLLRTLIAASVVLVDMASMTAVTVPAVPARLRTDLESSRSCPASTTVLMGQRKATAVSSRRSVVARASASEQVLVHYMYETYCRGKLGQFPLNVPRHCIYDGSNFRVMQAVVYSKRFLVSRTRRLML